MRDWDGRRRLGAVVRGLPCGLWWCPTGARFPRAWCWRAPRSWWRARLRVGWAVEARRAWTRAVWSWMWWPSGSRVSAAAACHVDATTAAASCPRLVRLSRRVRALGSTRCGRLGGCLYLCHPHRVSHHATGRQHTRRGSSCLSGINLGCGCSCLCGEQQATPTIVASVDGSSGTCQSGGQPLVLRQL